MWDGPALLKPGLLKLHVVGSKPSNEKSKHQLSTVASKPQRKSTQKRSEIDQKSTPDRLQNGPRSAQGAIGGPKGAQSAQGCPQKRPRLGPERHRRRPWTPQGRPRSDQVTPKSAQGGSKRLPKGVWEAQNRARGTREAKKSQFRQKCSATRPCRYARHFGPPQIDPKSVPNRSKTLPQTPQATSSVDIDPSEAPRAASASDSGRLGPPREPPGVAQGRLEPPRRARSFREVP